MIRTAAKAFAVLATAALIISGCGGGGHGASSSLPTVNNQNGGSNNASNGNNTSGPLTFVWGKGAVTNMAYVGPLTKPQGLTLAVSVKMQNSQGLVQYAASASDPTSGNYRQWLTPQQIGATYGARLTDYTNAANYFASNGLQVGGWPQREVLTVSGSTTAFAKAFGTTFGVYKYLGKQIVAPNGTPQFPSSVAVTAAVGLVGAPLPRTYFIHPQNSIFYGYSPQQIATGFDYSGAYNSGFTGAGINVGIIGTGPILASDGKDDDLTIWGQYWHAHVANITQVNAVPQPASSANGNTGSGYPGYPNGTFYGIGDDNPGGLSVAPPVTGAPGCDPSNTPSGIPDYTQCNPEDGEAQLDTQSVASLAPGANVLFYFAYNGAEYCQQTSSPYNVAPATGPTGNCPGGYSPWPYEGLALGDDEIQQAIADNKADALSMSFGEPELFASQFCYVNGSGCAPGQVGLGQVEMASLAAEGIAVFVSSGDDGAWECFDYMTGYYTGQACASYPASDPNVVAVGGVNIPLDESGNLTGSITAWADNTTQGGNGGFGNNVGSGGGVSTIFTAPAWQAATLGNSMRYLPDISLDADPDTGASVLEYGDLGFAPFDVGGTSQAAPEAAAMWGVVLQACKSSATCNKGGSTGYRMGNPAPLFYAIYAKGNSLSGAYTPSGFTPQLGYSQVFYDVVYGSNQAVPSPANTPSSGATPVGYNSGPGYDQVTGVGAPFVGHLITAVTGTNVP